MFSVTHRSAFSARKRRAYSHSGFTLIELLMVIAVIMVLASITFGISRGVQNAQARAAAKAELAVISQAIEQFKLRYGDYPWHDSGGSDTNKMLLYALTGRLSMEKVQQADGSTNVVVATISDGMDNEDVMKRPKFIDDTKLSVNEDSSGNSIELIDPWGNPYVYWYKWESTENSSPTWDVFGYHLYSTGADSVEDRSGITESTGVMSSTYRDADENIDNIYSGE